MGDSGDDGVDVVPPGPITRGEKKETNKKTAFTHLVHGMFSCSRQNLQAAARSPDIFVT